jgi:hypothetical protein
VSFRILISIAKQHSFLILCPRNKLLPVKARSVAHFRLSLRTVMSNVASVIVALAAVFTPSTIEAASSAASPSVYTFATANTTVRLNGVDYTSCEGELGWCCQQGESSSLDSTTTAVIQDPKKSTTSTSSLHTSKFAVIPTLVSTAEASSLVASLNGITLDQDPDSVDGEPTFVRTSSTVQKRICCALAAPTHLHQRLRFGCTTSHPRRHC